MSELNPKIFKPYDIRGIYPTDLDEDVALAVGQAYAKLTRSKKVAVGRDMRLGSPSLTKKLIEGLTSQGANVDDLGLVSIDQVYFAVGKYNYDGGIMATASHNPKEYNGFKMMKKAEHGLEYVRGTELYEFLTKEKVFKPAKKPGLVAQRDVQEEFIQHVMAFADVKKIKPFKSFLTVSGFGFLRYSLTFSGSKFPRKLSISNISLRPNPSYPESVFEIVGVKITVLLLFLALPLLLNLSSTISMDITV